jgi:hypothetical protein
MVPVPSVPGLPLTSFPYVGVPHKVRFGGTGRCLSPRKGTSSEPDSLPHDID